MKTISISSLGIKPEDIARFWSNVAKSEDLFSCWKWKASKSRGYGKIRIDDKYIKAHRFAYFLTNGAIPEGFMVLHKCNNPSCVRPSHLYAGTNSDNQIDALKRGTQSWQKLFVDQVKEIRKRLAVGEPHTQIAEDFPVSRSVISHISHGDIWSFIRK